MTPEQGALLQKARDSLRGAKLLAGEGLHDFAASRAYYAMFYVAEAFLLGEGISFSKHSATITEFGRRFARTGIVPPEYHRYLIDAHDKRAVGDYAIGPGLTEGQAADQIAHAEQFLELATRLINREDPTGESGSNP